MGRDSTRKGETMKKVIRRAMAFALTAAMVLGSTVVVNAASEKKVAEAKVVIPVVEVPETSYADEFVITMEAYGNKEAAANEDAYRAVVTLPNAKKAAEMILDAENDVQASGWASVFGKTKSYDTTVELPFDIPAEFNGLSYSLKKDVLNVKKWVFETDFEGETSSAYNLTDKTVTVTLWESEDVDVTGVTAKNPVANDLAKNVPFEIKIDSGRDASFNFVNDQTITVTLAGQYAPAYAEIEEMARTYGDQKTGTSARNITIETESTAGAVRDDVLLIGIPAGTGVSRWGYDVSMNTDVVVRIEGLNKSVNGTNLGCAQTVADALQTEIDRVGVAATDRFMAALSLANKAGSLSTDVKVDVYYELHSQVEIDADTQTVTYDGKDKAYDVSQVEVTLDGKALNVVPTVTYEKNGQAATPNAVGEYDVILTVADTYDYRGNTVKTKLIIEEAPDTAAPTYTDAKVTGDNTEKAVVTVSGIADKSALKDATYTYKLDGTAKSGSKAIASGKVELEFTTAGKYTEFKIVLEDAAGNKKTVAIDDFTVKAPDKEGPTYKDYSLVGNNTEKVTITVNEIADATGVASAEYSYKLDGKDNSKAATVSNGKLTLEFTTAGAYTNFEIVLKDTLGNITKFGITDFVVKGPETPDTAGPTYTAVKVDGNGTQKVVVTVSGIADTAGLADATITYNMGGKAYQETKAVENGTLSLAYTTVGKYEDYKIVLADKEGNKTEIPVAVFVVAAAPSGGSSSGSDSSTTTPTSPKTGDPAYNTVGANAGTVVSGLSESVAAAVTVGNANGPSAIVYVGVFAVLAVAFAALYLFVIRKRAN